MSPATVADSRPRARSGGRLRCALTAFAVAAVLTVGVLWGLLVAQGGHLYMVETPSMARTAPVGTLVVTQHVDPATLKAGDVITFRPPNVQRVYTHRIVEVTDQGLRTKGDLNGSPDGWVVPRGNVIGRAQHLWFGLGYVMRMIPWLALGGFVTAIVARFTRRDTRPAVLISGASLSFSLGLLLVRPLVGAQTIGFAPVDSTSVKISAVSTGVLPIRATSLDDRYVDLVAGELGWVTTAKHDGHGRYQLIPSLHLPWWGWLLMGLVCAVPLIASLLVRPRPDDAVPPGPPTGTPNRAAPTEPALVGGPLRPAAGATPVLVRRSHRRRTTRWASALSSLLVAVATAAGLTPTSSALTASVQNPTNTTQTRDFFTCLEAMQYYQDWAPRASIVTPSATTGKQLYLGYRLGDDSSGSDAGTDVQSGGMNRQASYGLQSSSSFTHVSPTAASDTGCQSDYLRRSQGYAHFNGTSNVVDIDIGSSVTASTSDPGNTQRMAFQEWFRVPNGYAKGGILACLGDSGNHCYTDRTTWMDNSGYLHFKVAGSILTSKNPLNDGKWHMAFAQIDGDAGSTLWIDGNIDATSPTMAGNTGTILYPQYGYSSSALNYGSAVEPADRYFYGDMQFVAIYGFKPPPNGGYTRPTWGFTDAEVKQLYLSAMP